MNRRIWVMVSCGVALVTVSMGLRQSFGVFLTPISADLEIGRQLFGFVIAAQVLLFGVVQPVVGYLADCFGAVPVVTKGALIYALGVIGLANIGGAYLSGALGDRFRKKTLLVLIYLGRALVMGMLLMVPLTQVSVLVFGVAMGLLWLGTVPLTSGIVAQVFGTRYFSMLYGVVFMSHQLGSFFGAWLGGYIYDVTGSYDLMWILSVALALVAAALHWPIEDRPLDRLAIAAK